VALKLLHAQLVGNQSAVERLKREIVLASRVSHPNVVLVYDFGQLHGNFYITMQVETPRRRLMGGWVAAIGLVARHHFLPSALACHPWATSTSRK